LIYLIYLFYWELLTEVQHIKLSDLTRQVEDVIKQTFNSTYWIIAEISDHTNYIDNVRHYFQFIEKEEGTNEPVVKVSGKAWTQGSQAIKYFEQETGQKFSNGLQVLVNVKVEYHSIHGFQLILTDINKEFTLGNLERQRRETLERLIKENPDSIKKIGEEYFTKNKQVKLNSVVQNIAIIGSPNSQGYTDFTHTISANQFGYKVKIDIYQSSVQGAGVEAEIINRLIAIFNSKIAYDAVVIIRGGGSKTDFLVFDTYPLARAVARFPIPVITGIGHHKDVSIVDMMTHTQTKTPTKAAEFIISHNRTFEDNLIIQQKTIAIKAQQMLANAQQKIAEINLTVVNKTRTSLARQKENIGSINLTINNKTRAILTRFKDALGGFNHIVVNSSKNILHSRRTNLVNLLNNIASRSKIVTATKQNDLNNIINNLKIFSESYFKNKRGYVGHFVELIDVQRPEKILKKGFAIVKKKGAIVKSAESIVAGEDITITMDLYDINTTVISKTPTNG
jgi:exodeoxyribonuclease VII large subunit